MWEGKGQRAGVPAPRGHISGVASQNEVHSIAGEDGSAAQILPWLMAVADAEESWRERRRKNPKRMGEASQAAFLLKAQSLELGVAVPWGDSEKYDFIVEPGDGGRLLRVQVKATGRLHRRGYEVQPVYATRGEGKKRYTAEEIDVLAAHVQTLDVWYLLPIAAVAQAKSLRFYPDIRSRRPMWEQYREAWEWLGVRGG
jgi:hypothetical protein